MTEDRVRAYFNIRPEGAKWPLGLVRHIEFERNGWF